MYSAVDIALLTGLLLFISVGLLLVALNYTLVPRTSGQVDKSYAYECGFEPFSSARERTSIHFYLVSILFLIFDIEIIFLFPWVVSLGKLCNSQVITFVSVLTFLWMLTIGFIYEFLNKALDW